MCIRTVTAPVKLLPAAVLLLFLAVSCSRHNPAEPLPPTPPAELAIVLPGSVMETGERIAFKAELTGAVPGSAAYRWDFGDGSAFVSGTDTISHVYFAAGTYGVVLRLTDPSTALDLRDTLSLTIIEATTLRFTLAVLIPVPFVGFPVVFESTASGAVPKSREYRWDFGDGSPAITTSEARMEHIFNAKGVYPVTAGLIDKATQSVAATSGVTVAVRDARFDIDIEPDTVWCAVNGTVALRADVLDGPIPGDKTYSWEFGNGATFSVRSPDDFSNVTRTYRRAGTFAVTIRLESDFFPGVVLARDTAWAVVR